MDTIKLIKVLQNKINSASSADEVLYLSACIENLNLGNVKTVTAYTDLLPLFPKKGEVYFVENEEKLYYGFGDYWYTIFDTSTAPIYAWGYNNRGQLGDSTIPPNKSSPALVVGGFTDWTQVSAGASHSLGVRANGTLYSWGLNSSGQLGDNNTRIRNSPVTIVGGFTDWVKISASNFRSLGIRSNGTIWTWGPANYGNLGNNSGLDRSSPVSVVGGFTDWIQASVGDRHSLAVRANGTLWSWGGGGNGRLGDNTIVNKSSPVSVVGGFTDWFQASCSPGAAHSLGIRGTGILYSWGSNTFGTLGDNTTVSKSSPVLVAGGFTDWAQVSAGASHSLGVRANGTLWAWGYGNRGQLGDSTIINKSSPVSVVGGFTNWTQASAGGIGFSLGLRANGTLYSWGSGDFGRLGDGTIASKSSPVLVAGGFTDWVQVSAGNSHALGLRIQ